MNFFHLAVVDFQKKTLFRGFVERDVNYVEKDDNAKWL